MLTVLDEYTQQALCVAVKVRMVRHHKTSPNSHQSMAETIQLHPPTSGPQHEATHTRNSIKKWPITRGLYREACDDPRELRRQIFGAGLMGAGSILAVGCSIGQGLSAFALLTFSAPLALICIFIGAAFGLKQLIEGFKESSKEVPAKLEYFFGFPID